MSNPPFNAATRRSAFSISLSWLLCTLLVITPLFTGMGKAGARSVNNSQVQLTANELVTLPSPEVDFLIGPQVRSGTSTLPGASWFDQNAIDRGLSLCSAFPDEAHTPGNIPVTGTVSLTNGSRTVTGVGTHFLTEAKDYAIISNGTSGRLIKLVSSVQGDTSLTLTHAWQGATLSGQTMSSPTATEVDNYQGYLNYYDFAFTQYTNYYRTGDARFLACARKVADSWWSQPVIDYGRNLTSVSGAGPAPRTVALNGLILSALDGRPELWPWITDYVRDQFRNWVEVPTGWAEASPTTAPLYFGIRDGGFMLLYAANLAAVHPDATIRDEFRAKVLRSATNYYAALQKSDGSYRWNDEGFPFSGAEQPFQVGILNEGMIAVHRLTNDERVKAAILKSVDHEYARSYNRTWGGLYYFIHGTIASNPIVNCETGCGAAANPFPPADTSQIAEVRQLNATAIHQFGYAYFISGDPKYRTQGDEIFAATYSGADGYRGLAAYRGKEYDESYRTGHKYLAWRLGSGLPAPSPPPTPSPTATSHFQLISPIFNVFEGGGSAHLTVERTNPTGAASVDYRTSDTAGLVNCNLVNGVASARCDYTIAVGTLRFAPGESAKNISIPIVEDGYADGNENFSIRLSNANGATLGSPSVATITIQDKASNGTNPIDGTAFFVRQQYLDFLNREPNPGASAAWQQVIDNCQRGDTTCDRIHVSSAFFRSPEFQDRGYFVYRFYPVSFGRKPDYAEFTPDMAKVSAFLSAAELDAAKVAFIEEFMSRPGFVTKFNGLTDTQYVDTLLATAGVTSPNRDFWIAVLGNGTRTRATVLRDISESTEVYNRYYNQAFVVMQYFGYLRRDPDASYLDWIEVLNSSGDFRGMVNGFMNSLEYRSRFGPRTRAIQRRIRSLPGLSVP